jgi:hypothetical protein
LKPAQAGLVIIISIRKPIYCYMSTAEVILSHNVLDKTWMVAKKFLYLRKLLSTKHQIIVDLL